MPATSVARPRPNHSLTQLPSPRPSPSPRERESFRYFRAAEGEGAVPVSARRERSPSGFPAAEGEGALPIPSPPEGERARVRGRAGHEQHDHEQSALHPEHAEAVRAPHLVAVHGGERDPQHRARVARVDDAVVGDTPGGVERERFLLGPVFDGGDETRVLFLVERRARRARADPRRTIDMTPASCFGPMTAIFAVGQVNTKRVSYARPLMP